MATPPVCYNPLSMRSSAPLDLRPSPIAGTWYPADPTALASSIDRMLQTAATESLPGELVAIVVPHAGHRYSGPVAASAFRAVQLSQPEVVAIVAPLHRPHRARLLTSAHQAYWTPLGSVPLDHDRVAALQLDLAQHAGLELEAVLEDDEHALEIELPFLQRALQHPFRLVPVMIRDQSAFVAEALGHALARVLQPGPALLVASTDLSHFYPAEVARQLDGEMLARLEALDPTGVITAEDQGVGFACGRGAAAAVLWAAADLGADQARILAYAHSGDVTGDRSSVVGYGAAALMRSAPLPSGS